jgi:hypothetical protein
MPDYRLRARSAVPGAYNFKAGRLAFLPAVADVWNGVGRGDGTSGTKRASSIANCVAANIKDTVVIDDVVGNYGGGGVTDLPEIFNVLDTDTLDHVPGTYHGATIAEVKYGVVFGPASAYTGTYNAPHTGGLTIEEIRENIMAILCSTWATKTVIDMPNQAFQAPANAAWIRPRLKMGDSEVGELGTGVGLRTGVLMVSIFLPPGTGIKTGLGYANTLETLFRRADIGGVWFDEPSTDIVGLEDSGFYHLMMSCDLHSWVGEV